MSFALKVDARLKALEAKYEALLKRIEALEAKRGPGRPPNERNPAGSNRAL